MFQSDSGTGPEREEFSSAARLLTPTELLKIHRVGQKHLVFQHIIRRESKKIHYSRFSLARSCTQMKKLIVQIPLTKLRRRCRRTTTVAQGRKTSFVYNTFNTFKTISKSTRVLLTIGIKQFHTNAMMTTSHYL